MSHAFCAGEVGCDSTFPKHGWASWNDENDTNGKAIYVKIKIDSSVTHPEACGEAIRRWNEQVGARFLMTPDKGDVFITFFERGQNEWPFTDYRTTTSGQKIWGVCLNYDASGKMLGINPGLIVHSKIYMNRDVSGKNHLEWVNAWAHEISHSFGLADHPNDNINSVTSYQKQGRWLLGPSWEDVQGIAKIYGLKDLDVRPQDLDGIENILSIWYDDRYGKSRFLSGWRRWTFWVARFVPNGRSGASPNTIERLVPYETYMVKAKQEGLLGFGRFARGVYAGPDHYMWVYD